MTDDEKKAHEIIERWRANVRLRTGTGEREAGNKLADLAERLLAENSQLRVRDSNVTAHSLNVMAVNEDLTGRLKRLRDLCEAWDKGDGYDSYSSFEASGAVREILGDK